LILFNSTVFYFTSICYVLLTVLEQLGLEAEASYSTSLPRNFPPSRDVAMGDRQMVRSVCVMTVLVGWRVLWPRLYGCTVGGVAQW